MLFLKYYWQRFARPFGPCFATWRPCSRGPLARPSANKMCSWRLPDQMWKVLTVTFFDLSSGFGGDSSTDRVTEIHGENISWELRYMVSIRPSIYAYIILFLHGQIAEFIGPFWINHGQKKWRKPRLTSNMYVPKMCSNAEAQCC